MQVVPGVCCGLDVHKKSMTACVLWASVRRRQTRAFGTFTRELLELGDWLRRCLCQGLGRLDQEEQLFVGSLSPAGSAKRIETRDHCGRPQAPGHCLSHLARRNLLQRPRRRLLRSPEPRRPAQAFNQTARRPGLQSDPGALQLKSPRRDFLRNNFSPRSFRTRRISAV